MQLQLFVGELILLLFPCSHPEKLAHAPAEETAG